MIQNTQNRKNTLFRAFMCVLIGVLGVYLLLTPLSAKATNPYVSNIKFYAEEETNYYVVEFFVDTTFILDHEYPDYNVDASVNMHEPGEVPEIAGWFWKYNKIGSDNPLTYTAGNTYKNYIYTARQLYRIYPGSGFNYVSTGVYELDEGSHIDKLGNTEVYPQWANPVNPSWIENDDIYYTEYPSLTITYPLDEAEIASAFYITGSYTLPDASTLNKLMAYFGYDISGETRFYEFYQDVSPPSGSVNIRVAGLPARSYVVGYSFINTSDPEDYYMVLKWYDIHIVASIPPELPDGETPPSVFGITDPEVWRAAHSYYPTSTPMFAALSGAVKPLILTIGDNLVFFSSKFEQDKAKETGETLAGGVLVVRSYANNLNSFFSDLPISQALFLYLLLMVVVAIFRIIKNLINLIKP